MKTEKLLEIALNLAFEHHKGQYDKAGMPYILHPLRVMFSLDNPILKIIALLHDLIEDTQITISDLRTFDFPDETLDYPSANQEK